jgi:hypothetical protein
MCARATEGTCVAQLVKMSIPICRKAQHQCPRTGPGPKPEYQDWHIAMLILIAVLNRRKSKSAQYRFLHGRRLDLKRRLGLRHFPSRSTYMDRYRGAYPIFQQAVKIQGLRAIAEGVADPTTTAVDKSLAAARGPVWHRRRGRPCRPPRGADLQAGWGYSDHHGWVYGYSFETVVTAGPEGVVFPLLASCGPANTSECRTFVEKVPDLPVQTRYVLADRAYDTNANGEALECDASGRPTGRRLVCPLQGRAGKPQVGKFVQRGRREQLRQHRSKRQAFFKSPRGQKLYDRRRITIEPFHQWFKRCFDLTDRVWHRGLSNNQTQLLAAMFAYQLLVRYNRRCGGKNGEIQWILDGL